MLPSHTNHFTMRKNIPKHNIQYRYILSIKYSHPKQPLAMCTSGTSMMKPALALTNLTYLGPSSVLVKVKTSLWSGIFNKRLPLSSWKKRQKHTEIYIYIHWNLQCFLSMSLNAFNTTLGKWYIPSLSGGPWGGATIYIYTANSRGLPGTQRRNDNRIIIIIIIIITNQIKSNQIKSNQFKANQIKSNQIKLN